MLPSEVLVGCELAVKDTLTPFKLIFNGLKRHYSQLSFKKYKFLWTTLTLQVCILVTKTKQNKTNAF